MNWDHRPEGSVRRFLVLAWDDYYPAGGTGPWMGDFDAIEGARAAVVDITKYDATRRWTYDNACIVDLHTGREVA